MSYIANILQVETWPLGDPRVKKKFKIQKSFIFTPNFKKLHLESLYVAQIIMALNKLRSSPLCNLGVFRIRQGIFSMMATEILTAE